MWKTNLNFALLLTLQILLCTGLEKGYKLLGSRCTDSRDCYENELDNETMRCTDGRCHCNTPYYILLVADQYGPDKGNVLGCKDASTTTMSINKGIFGTCEDSSVGVLCRCMKGSMLQEVNRGRDEICMFSSPRSLGSPCGYNFCNYEKQLTCIAGKCICDWDLMYDFEMSECTSKATYMNQNNLTEYKVTHGVYCTSTTDCIEGLVCDTLDYLCSCPRECSYTEEEESCDCGEIEEVTPPSANLSVSGPVTVGMIAGCITIVCWYTVIKDLVKSHFKEKASSDESEAPSINGQSEGATNRTANTLPYNIITRTHNTRNPVYAATTPGYMPIPTSNLNSPPDSGQVSVPAHENQSSDLLGFDLSSGPTAMGNYTGSSAPAFPASAPPPPYSLHPPNPTTGRTTQASDSMDAPPSYEEAMKT